VTPNFDYQPSSTRKAAEIETAPETETTLETQIDAVPEARTNGSKTYDIQDAIAEVTAVTTARPIPVAPRTNPEWQSIDTAPLDRDVQVGINVEGGVLPIFFPCRRTEGGWMNAIVRAPLLHEPTCWREWPEK
jgi:hypothetical protein